MHICALCGKAVDIGRSMSGKEVCPHCRGDLHICLNCRFYSSTSSGECKEPKAERQRHIDKANFCDYFQFRESEGGLSIDSEKAEAMRKLDGLFKKN